MNKHLSKGKLHLNDKGIPRFVRNFWDFLKVFETVSHESNHNLFDVSISSSLTRSFSLSKTDNDFLRIKQQGIEHAKSTIICHLNINSIRSKFDKWDEIVKALYIFLISESKLGNTFSINQFSIRRGYKVFRRDRNPFGDGLILYANEDIPCKPLTDHPVFSDLELMAFELHQSKRKWLLLGIYKPPSQNDIEFLNRISLIIDYYLGTYEHILAIGDLNLSVDNSHLVAFMQAYDFSSLFKKPTWYQSNTPNCIDLILTNRKSLFKSLS